MEEFAAWQRGEDVDLEYRVDAGAGQEREGGGVVALVDLEEGVDAGSGQEREGGGR